MKSSVRGFTLVEIVVGAAIILIFISALASSLALFVSVLPERTRHVQASMLAQEAIEAVKQLRNTSWDGNIATLDLETEYYLSWSGGWQLSETPSEIDGTFTRTVVFEEVYRDGSDAIAESGTIDPGTLKVTAEVSWNEAAETETITTYITDIFDN